MLELLEILKRHERFNNNRVEIQKIALTNIKVFCCFVCVCVPVTFVLHTGGLSRRNARITPATPWYAPFFVRRCRVVMAESLLVLLRVIVARVEREIGEL